MKLQIVPDSVSLVETAASLFTERAIAAMAARGRFSIALSGGNTPREVYARLASSDYADRIPWQAIHFFWGDERCVAPAHADSNYRMVAESLLNHVPVPVENIHRVQGELVPDQAADRYEAELRAFFGETPVFDLIFLGLGEDGHTASLFAGSPALAESARWAVAAEHTTPPLPLVSRVTLTFSVFNAARQVLFLVSGASKAARLAEIRRGATDLPAARVQPVSGDLLWIVDQAAAAGINQ